MVFQKLALITLAAAGLASAVAVERRGDATCTFSVLASAAPAAGTDLATEFNYLLGREFATNFSGQPVSGAASAVTGPAPTNVYSVVKGFSVDTASDSEVKTLVESWAGKTFSGPWSGVTWTVQSVAC